MPRTSTSDRRPSISKGLSKDCSSWNAIGYSTKDHVLPVNASRVPAARDRLDDPVTSERGSAVLSGLSYRSFKARGTYTLFADSVVPNPEPVEYNR